MSEAELQTGTEIDNEEIIRLADQLPTYFPKGETSNNFKLLGPVAARLLEINDGIKKLEEETKVSTANSIEGLHELGKLVDTHPRTDEDLEHYRVRVMTAFQNVTNEASIGDIMDNVSFVLEINIERLQYLSSDVPGNILLGIPQSAIDNSPLSVDELLNILNDNIAAGYEIDGIATGTFEYITPEDYELDNHDPDKGYTTLDEDGNKIDKGGTYSTVLE